MDNPSAASGACACGHVRFEIDLPTLFFSHCHCEDCRRAHGAAVVSWVGARESAFRYLAGGDTMRWHASSKQGRRGFCGRCGTPLFFQSTLDPGEIHVARPAIRTAIDRAPASHVFHDRRVDWLHVADDLPKLDAGTGPIAKYSAVEYR
jgi:hypothetical protein